MKRSSFRATANEIADLRSLVEIHELTLSEKELESLRDVATRMSISPSSLVTLVQRLNNRYGPPKIIDTVKGHKGIEITSFGLSLVYTATHIFDQFSTIKDNVSKRITSRHKRATIGASPYIVSHIVPPAIKSFAERSDKYYEIHIHEAYNDDEFLDALNRHELEFAVVWNYSGRAEKIKQMPDFDCALSERTFDAYIAFNMNHPLFAPRLKEGPYGVGIGELADEKVYVLEQGHRFLANQLPIPNRLSKAERIYSYSIASSIGSIRSSKQGVAIVPGVFRDLDGYRADASLGFLPLYSEPKKENWSSPMSIELLYVFRFSNGTKTKVKHVETLNIANLDYYKSLINDAALSFLSTLENSLNQEPKASGWSNADDVSGRIKEVSENIEKYEHIYFISTNEIGMKPPEWYYAKADLNYIGNHSPGSSKADNNRSEIEGSMTVHKPGELPHRYDIRGHRIGDRLLNLYGFSTAKKKPRKGDCFSANLNFAIMAGKKTALVGIWSGRDSSSTQPMSGPFVISTNLLNITYLKNIVHNAMIRQMRSVRADETPLKDYLSLESE